MIEVLSQPDGNRALIERAWDSTKQRFNQELAVTGNENILKQLATQGRRTTR
jgi:hypothetical protein